MLRRSATKMTLQKTVKSKNETTLVDLWLSSKTKYATQFSKLCKIQKTNFDTLNIGKCLSDLVIWRHLKSFDFL
jgi:hypothetical protein